MSPGRFDESVIRVKLESLREMLRGIETLPLASFEELAADPRMLAAGESYLRRAQAALAAFAAAGGSACPLSRAEPRAAVTPGS